MHVASEEGDFLYKKSSVALAYEPEHDHHPNSVQMVPMVDPTVCGFYVVADPYKTVEISFHHLDASCESGALLGVSATERERVVLGVIFVHPQNLPSSSSTDGS